MIAAIFSINFMKFLEIIGIFMGCYLACIFLGVCAIFAYRESRNIIYRIVDKIDKALKK